MPFLFRFTTYATCAAIGTAIPFIANFDVTQSEISPSLAFHSSSRMMPMEVSVSSVDIAERRSQIWALTQHAGDMPCNGHTCTDSAAID